MKKLSKQDQYYKGLQKTVYSMVTIELDNINEIEKEVSEYTAKQPFLNRLNKNHMDEELLIYIIGERFVDVVLETLSKKYPTKSEATLEYRHLEKYIFDKIYSIGLYDLIIPCPEQIPLKLIKYKRGYMKREFAKLTGLTD